MSDSPPHVVEFDQADGGRVALLARTIEALVELEDGLCQLVTGTDVYRVRIGYIEASTRTWPERS